MTPPVALTIAGSDSGGGAGIQADLATFAAHQVHGTTAITAITAQDTTAVHAVHALPAAVVRAQMEVVLADFPVAAVKTGMLAIPETVRLVGAQAARGRLPHLVVDPVLVSSTGHPLLGGDGPALYLEHLVPHAAVLTPNVDEAAALLGRPVRTPAQMRAAAADLAALGPTVVVTGGHLDTGDGTLDVLQDNGSTYELTGPRVQTRNTHGTGCTFAAALAARLALGDGVLVAAQQAKRYVTAALAGASNWRLGHGAGPLDHLAPAGPTPQESR